MKNNSEINFKGHSFVAFGVKGDYVREAQTIDELPNELRLHAINRASQVLGMKVEFGVPIKTSNKIKPREAAKDKTGLINKRGCDLPLSLIA